MSPSAISNIALLLSKIMKAEYTRQGGRLMAICAAVYFEDWVLDGPVGAEPHQF